MKVIAIIQARIESERLPGKVLMNLPFGSGQPLLKWITDSINSSEIVDKCIVATSVNAENEQIEEFCNKNNLQCFKGSEEDVLSRFITITKNEEADVVIRLTGDNPVLDIGILDQVINEHLVSDSDYTASFGLPLGMNFEIISGQAFLSINEEVTQAEKEHVTLYFKNRDEYKKKSVSLRENEELNNLRVTVDYPEDYLVVSHLLSNLKKDELPSLSVVKRIFDETPWVFRANSGKIQKRVLSDFSEEKKEAVQLLKEKGFKHSADKLENA